MNFILLPAQERTPSHAKGDPSPPLSRSTVYEKQSPLHFSPCEDRSPFA